MSRAVRRQQQASDKENATQKRRPSLGLKRPTPTRGARPPSQPRRRFRLHRPSWMEDIVSELKKVTWPTPAETRYLTMVVIIVALTVGAMLGMIDIFFNWLIDRTLLR